MLFSTGDHEKMWEKWYRWQNNTLSQKDYYLSPTEFERTTYAEDGKTVLKREFIKR